MPVLIRNDGWNEAKLMKWGFGHPGVGLEQNRYRQRIRDTLNFSGPNLLSQTDAEYARLSVALGRILVDLCNLVINNEFRTKEESCRAFALQSSFMLFTAVAVSSRCCIGIRPCSTPRS